jgi:hypothetical protein
MPTSRIRIIVSQAIVLGCILGLSSLLIGCGSSEPSEQAKIDAKKESDAQLERAAELYRKRQQAGQSR